MANTDTVIVDIPALKEAISSFRNCSNALDKCVSSLQANSAEIQAAVKSQASDIYQGKMQKLSSNVGNAQAELNVKIRDLETMCSRSEEAERKAQGIAEQVESNFML